MPSAEGQRSEAESTSELLFRKRLQNPKASREGRGTLWDTHTHAETHSFPGTFLRSPGTSPWKRHPSPDRGAEAPCNGEEARQAAVRPPSPPATTGPPHTSSGRPSGQEGGLGADTGPGRPLWACSFSPASHVDAIRVLPSRVRRSRSTAEGSEHTGTRALRAGVAKGVHGSSLGDTGQVRTLCFSKRGLESERFEWLFNVGICLKRQDVGLT